MELLLVRHAIAEDREVFAATGRPDEERPLTDYGRRRMIRNVRGLRRVAPGVELVASSPLVRAVETARIIAEAFELENIVETDSLCPDAHPDAFADWLRLYSDRQLVALVGHEPHLGTLLTWLLTGSERSRVSFKKGGAAKVEISGPAAAGSALLHWSIPPKELRRLGE